jgi:hypothetical protein
MAKKATNTENSGSLRDRLLKTSTIKETSILGDSKIFQPQTFYDTGIPLINLALSTEVDKGLFPGITIIAGPSKHFKSKFALELLSGFLKNSEKGIGLIYDNEFGSPAKYFESSSIDTDRVIYSPIMNLEELKFDLVKQLEHITKDDEVCILIDSIGNLASKKELDDALDGESKQDMTRAKVLKSIFRMITPYVKMKNIPLIGIGHTYQTQEMYSRSVVSGGCLIEGTLIRTDKGLKSIEKISVGDLVETLDGYKEVTHTWNPDTLFDGEPECYEIEFEDGSIVTCSDEHKFLLNDEWVEAKYLISGDSIKSV